MDFKVRDKVEIVNLSQYDKLINSKVKVGDILIIRRIERDLLYCDNENINPLWLSTNQISKTSLPIGNFTWDLGYGWGLPEETEKPKEKSKCECGMNSILGHEGDNPELHYSWCPIYKEKK